MIIETGILIAAVALGILALGFSRLFHKNSRQNRNLIEFLGKQIENLEESLTENQKKLETNSKRLADQSRRVAWLETRVRQPRTLKDDVLNASVLSDAPKSNITERRHRVLALASRGQDAKKIASTLGMMIGEVELIISLNSAAV